MKKTTIKNSKNPSLVLEIINKIKKEIEEVRIPREKMIQELKMMNFKIKPVIGDLFQAAKKQDLFLESLWKIGKIDKIVSFYIDQLSEEEKKILFQYLENFKQTKTINSLPLSEKNSPNEEITVLEVQLYKKSSINKKNLN